MRRPKVSNKSSIAFEQTTSTINKRRTKPRQNWGLRVSIVFTLICFLLIGVILKYLILAVLQNVKIGTVLLFGNSHEYSAVERAKYYGLPQRKFNSGLGDPSLWKKLGNVTCDDQGSPAMLEQKEIQRLQLPQAILIGVQKGGTTALFHYLDQHPSMERTKKELYFLDEELDRLVAQKGKLPRKTGRNLYHQKMRDGIVEARALEKQKNRHKDQLKLKLKDRVPLADNLVKDNKQMIRQRRLQEAANLATIRGNDKKKRELDDGFSRSHHGPPPNSLEHKPIPETSTSKYVMDLTPNYMFHSDRVPQRIACLVPWVRLLVLLRNPIARARSQYNMKLRMVLPKRHNSFGNPIPSLDEYITNDLDALEEVGVLHNWTNVDFDTFWESEACWKAWHDYIHRGLNAPVGMGLYALQLKPFLDVLQDIHNGAPSWEEVRSNYFLAMDSQDLQLETDKTYQQVLKFLQLSPLSLTEYARVNKASDSSSSSSINKELGQSRLSHAVQKRMEDAIAPYNQKLGDLLGEEWRNKWTLSNAIS